MEVKLVQCFGNAALFFNASLAKHWILEEVIQNIYILWITLSGEGIASHCNRLSGADRVYRFEVWPAKAHR